MDLTREGASDGSAVREVGIKIHGDWAEHGGASHKAVWALLVRTHRRLVFDPPMLGLGEDVVAGPPGADRRIIISAERPIGSLKVSSEPKGWKTHLARIGETRYQLTTVPIREESGAFKETITVEGMDRDGQPLPRHRLNVEGYAIPVVRAYPEETDLGAVKAGRPYSCIVLIKADKGEISRIEPGEAFPGVALDTVSPDENGRWRVKITVIPDQDAHRQITSKLKVQLDGGRWHDVEYRLRWHRDAN